MPEGRNYLPAAQPQRRKNMAGNYIPKSHAAYALWFDKVVKEVVIHTTGAEPEWHHIPAEAVTALREKHDEWTDAFGAALDDPTKAKNEARNDAQKSSEKTVRAFVKQYLRFSPVTNEQRTEMEIPNEDTIKTKPPIPTAGPPSKTKTSSAAPGVVLVFYIGAKPKGVDRVEAEYGIADEPITDFAKLTHSESVSHNPLEVTIPEHSRKTFSYRLRYLLKEGASPWSEIRSVTIP
jgi:hypothetical protein